VGHWALEGWVAVVRGVGAAGCLPVPAGAVVQKPRHNPAWEQNSKAARFVEGVVQKRLQKAWDG